MRLNRSKAVTKFKSSVGPRCIPVNLARPGKKSPLPAVCPSPLEEVRSLPPITLNRTDHANVPYQRQQKATDAHFCHDRKQFGIEAGQMQTDHHVCQLPCAGVSLPSRDEQERQSALPGIANRFQTTGWDFQSSRFSSKLLTAGGNNGLSKKRDIVLCIPQQHPSLLPFPSKWKGQYLCSHIRVHQLLFAINGIH